MSSRSRGATRRALGFVLALVLVTVVVIANVKRDVPESTRAAGPSHAPREASEPRRGLGPRLVPPVEAREPGESFERSEPRVRGQVVDRDEGPLGEGSLVLACPEVGVIGRASIDDEGGFEGPACPDGPTCARLIHPGSHQREAWRLDAEVPVELEVEPAPRIAGLVRSAAGAVEGAEIFVRRGERRWSSRSDPEGAFMVSLGATSLADDHDPCTVEPEPSDPFALTILAADLRPQGASVPAGGDEQLEIMLTEPAPPLLGRLIDREGRAFTRARVLARSHERPDEAHAITPDAAGEFALTSLGAGAYELRAIQDGVELARVEAQAGANVVMRATLAARGPTLELVVRDSETREACMGVRVDGGPFRAARTDAQGKVEALDVLAGPVSLSLRSGSEGGSRERVEIPPGERGQTIALDLSLACEH